jgi:hypothetical protein
MSQDQSDPFALNPDGSAADPAAFRAALHGDAGKMAALDADPQLREVLLGEDVAAMQALLQEVYQVRQPGGRRQGPPPLPRYRSSGRRANALEAPADAPHARARALVPPSRI